MSEFNDIIETIINNPLYIILTASLAVMIVWSLIKKLYKLAIIFSICCVVYLVYIYIETPDEIEKQAKKIKNQAEKVIELYIETPDEIEKQAKKIKNQAEKVIEHGRETLKNFKQETEKNID